ncbi:alpha-L-fucosidase [Paenibacillus sp. SYP-B3998]|uniref:alpha-L-fucosidase n=1 Tax=Paenibacillus sp. SYP-B3998 TaxID=2678564 RepID=A0A6G3ZRV5_9BACL|nr:alpha-L-fucosidase [Paenibacillus sp. SYP-B3998]NEW04768.1 alpha-L-fucosidase [Paenibacillus sp. SYP-B3998]
MERYELAKPTKQQMEWQDLELGMFCHFGINTFCNKEWSDGTEPVSIFNPAELDASQWVKTAKQVGFKYFILTAKHHDGFCLWPTQTTDYSVRTTSWKEGRGDVVREAAEACRRENIGFGIYVSPWDRNAACYSDPQAYDDFYAAQLIELLTQYGPLVEVWFDGAGSEGRQYDWKRIISLVKQHQPDAMIFNLGAPTIRWAGNEDGVAEYPCWNTAETAKVSMFTNSTNQWLPETPRWVPAECDVPIRKNHWFWHPNDEHSLLSLDQLLDVYYRSVGHGATLLLNVAPDNRGLLPECDVQRVLEFGKEIRRRFSQPKGSVSASGDFIELVFTCETAINHVVTMEDIAHGERILAYVIEAEQEGHWVEIANGSAIGHKKIDRFPSIRTKRIRLLVKEQAAEPRLRSFAGYYAAETESLDEE